MLAAAKHAGRVGGRGPRRGSDGLAGRRWEFPPLRAPVQSVSSHRPLRQASPGPTCHCVPLRGGRRPAPTAARAHSARLRSGTRVAGVAAAATLRSRTPVNPGQPRTTDTRTARRRRTARTPSTASASGTPGTVVTSFASWRVTACLGDSDRLIGAVACRCTYHCIFCPHYSSQRISRTCHRKWQNNVSGSSHRPTFLCQNPGNMKGPPFDRLHWPVETAFDSNGVVGAE